MDNSSTVSRRDILKLGTAAAAGAAVLQLGAPEAVAQTPKRGGIFRIRHHVQPVHFDPQQTIAFSTQMPLSYCMSRLVKVKAGPSVVPGTQPIEGDLAESWTQQNETTYVFKLRKGVRWHPKPPVNGRELTAEDVKYTYERFLTVKGNPNRPVLEQVDKVEALDPHTVRFVLKEPFAWFLDALASTSTWIVAKEAVEKFGDLKKPEAVVGTGPWMLERYDPGTRIVYVRNPNYFLPGLPYADGVDVAIDTDPAAASRELHHRPLRLRTGVRPGRAAQRSRDRALEDSPAADEGLHRRVRRHHVDEARSGAVQGRARAARARHREQLARGARDQRVVARQGQPNPAVPAALKEWSIPIDQLPPEGRRLYEYDTASAKRLLAEAGLPTGFKTPYETTAGYGPDYMDAVQIGLKNWKAAGIDAELKLKEYGAFISSTIFGKFEKMAGGLFGATTDADAYVHRVYTPGQPLNAGGVDDPKLTEMIRLQRRTFDVAKRRDILWDLQRYASQQVYYVYGPSVSAVSAWYPYVKNFGPNIGHDVGGRILAAWLDK